MINDSQVTDSRYENMHQNVDVDLGDDTLLAGLANNNILDTEQSQHAQQYNMDCSMITTESDINRWKAFSQNITGNGMVQSTIYHIRQLGQNIFDPEEKEKYYCDDFLHNVRHVNDKVE